MNLLSDIITYIRRIVKTPSDAVLSDALIIDYINRFWILDVDARIQLFDLKTKYQFQTTPGVDKYNMPLYSVQTETTNPSQNIAMFPVYQGFLGPAYINGEEVVFQTQKGPFFRVWPNIVQNLQVVGIGNGGSTYTLTFPILPNFPNPPNPPLQGLLRGHVDINGIIATSANVDPPIASSATFANLLAKIPTTSIDANVFITSIDSNGSNVVVQDSGVFLTGNPNYGMLIQPGSAPFGNSILTGGYSITSNTINYFTGVANVTFPVAIPSGNNISAQCYFFQTGLPRAILYYNNVLTLRAPPSNQFLVELDAYLAPAAFFNTEQSIPFAYMSEYIARGAARKILSDTGDWDQFNAYESLFMEQEQLVWKRSQRQFTSTRTQTIYSQGVSNESYGNTVTGGFGI